MEADHGNWEAVEVNGLNQGLREESKVGEGVQEMKTGASTWMLKGGQRCT